MALLPKEIFKAYDIRGIVGKTLTPAFVKTIGQAIGSEAMDRGQKDICIGFDGRLSGPELSQSLIKGILKTGINVINLGMVTTPMVYFSTFFLKTQSGVMVKGSHNPPDYNGLKIVLGGDTLSTEAIQKLYTRIKEENFHRGQGSEKKYDIANDYIEAIKNHIHLKRPMKIVIDCGNGVAGAYARQIYESIGCSVEELFCDVDGTFPNHHPDPSEPHNLNDVIAHLKKSDAELGFAFDGDADRLGVVTRDGQIIYPDRQLLLFAEDVLSRNPNATIIFDVKSTRNLFQWIKDKGGKPLMWKTGHSLIKAKMKEEKAALAGEMSGHTFFKERWYGFDDGIYAGVRLLEILSRYDNPSDVLNNLPNSISTPELQIKMKEGEPHALIKKLQTEAQFDNALEIIKVDGLRVEYQDGFGLMRASNTTPVIVLRFEAENKSALERIQNSFRNVLSQASPGSHLPF